MYLSLRRSWATAMVAASALSGCTFHPLYPSRPAASVGEPVTEPLPSRVVAHLTLTSSGLRSALDTTIATHGEGTFPMLGGVRSYTWTRGPFAVSFAAGKIAIETDATAVVSLPLHSATFPLHLKVEAAPVVSSEYAVKLQEVTVKVASSDSRMELADRFAAVYTTLEKAILSDLTAFNFELRPLLEKAETSLATPVDIPVGDAHGCATLRLLGVEAGPSIFADGLEKDLALVVAPEISLPCARSAANTHGFPPLANVAQVPSGPFTVTVPFVAAYDELARAMTAAFTNGKLFFSKEYPELYLENPMVYEADGALVLQLHLSGPVHKNGITADMNGDLFLKGHPQVIDNELRIPDLEPTIETSNFFLMLKAASDGAGMRDEARRALRLDISERLASVRKKLSSELTLQAGPACLEAEVDRIVVTGVHPHANYLRIYVDITAQARLSVPCRTPGPPAPPTAEPAANSAK